MLHCLVLHNLVLHCLVLHCSVLHWFFYVDFVTSSLITLASWVPYRYSCNVDMCDDCKRILPLMESSPSPFGLALFPLTMADLLKMTKYDSQIYTKRNNTHMFTDVQEAQNQDLKSLKNIFSKSFKVFYRFKISHV